MNDDNEKIRQIELKDHGDEHFVFQRQDYDLLMTSNGVIIIPTMIVDEMEKREMVIENLLNDMVQEDE